MFEGFANVWTPVLPAAELRRELSTIDFLGERVVLYREESGKPRALVEDVSERGDSPKRLPAHEEAGLIWLFSGPEPPGASPKPPPALCEAGLRLGFYVESWPARFSRVMAALLDVDNHPFVLAKGGSTGRDAARRLHIDEHPWGRRVSVSFGDRAPERVLSFHEPNVIELFLSPIGAPHERKTFVFCVPEAASSTRVLFCSALADGAAPTSTTSWITDFLVATSLARERATEPERELEDVAELARA